MLQLYQVISIQTSDVYTNCICVSKKYGVVSYDLYTNSKNVVNKWLYRTEPMPQDHEATFIYASHHTLVMPYLPDSECNLELFPCLIEFYTFSVSVLDW